MKALFGVTLLATCFAPVAAQELSPYLSLRANGPIAGADQGLTVHARDESLLWPGESRTLSATTSWSPVSNLVLNAGVSQAASGPCPAPRDGDCAWTTVAEPVQQRGFSVGASWQPLDSLSVSVDYRDAANEQRAVYLSGDGLGVFIDSQDLSLSCELDTESWGNLELGLQVSRWADGLNEPTAGADPYTSAALGVGWRWGAFRGGVTGRSTQVLGADQDSQWNTLDLDFAWRTPWNASLSVGARNVLDQPAPNASGIDEPGMDDFLGRVPYVRYQQDL